MQPEPLVSYGAPLELTRSEQASLAAFTGGPVAWTPIRHLGDHSVFVAPDRSGAPAWICKLAQPEAFARLQRQADWAMRLEQLRREPAASWLGSLRADEWRLCELGERRALLLPYRSGIALGREGYLNEAECAEQRERQPQLRMVLGLLDVLGDQLETGETVRAADHASRFAEHAAVAVAGGRLDQERGRDALARFARLTDDWRRPARFAHGELTPWHILVASDGLVLLDLETMSTAEARYTDLTVLVMRMWALQGDRAGALALLRDVYRANPPALRAQFWADTAWMWLYAAVRALAESTRWSRSDAAQDFAAWAWRMSDPACGDEGLLRSLV